MAENTIQVSLVAFSDNSYNAPLAPIEYSIDSAATAAVQLLQVIKNPFSVLRRYSIDSIAGSYIDEFDITHNKFDAWDVLTLIFFVTCTANVRLLSTVLTAAINLPINAASQATIDIHNKAAIYVDTLGESSYTFPVFYRTRRVFLPWNTFSVFQFIEDVQRMGSLYADVISESVFEWTNPYLFLKRRIYANIEPFAVLELIFTLWKEGNPAIRIEPLKWYKKRLDPGDIVIKENPWI